MAKKTLTTEENAPKQKATRKKTTPKSKVDEAEKMTPVEDIAEPAEPENTVEDVPPADEKPENIDNPPEDDIAEPAEPENTIGDEPPADEKPENIDTPPEEEKQESKPIGKAVKRMPLPKRRLSVRINPTVGHDYWFGQSRGR